MGFAAALGDLGYHDEARQVWSKLMSIQPAYSFADRIAPMPFKKPEDLTRIAKGLNRAGLLAASWEA